MHSPPDGPIRAPDAQPAKRRIRAPDSQPLDSVFRTANVSLSRAPKLAGSCWNAHNVNDKHRKLALMRFRDPAKKTLGPLRNFGLWSSRTSSTGAGQNYAPPQRSKWCIILSNRREMALELVAGADFLCKWMCGAGPVDLRGPGCPGAAQTPKIDDFRSSFWTSVVHNFVLHLLRVVPTPGTQRPWPPNMWIRALVVASVNGSGLPLPKRGGNFGAYKIWKFLKGRR